MWFEHKFNNLNILKVFSYLNYKLRITVNFFVQNHQCIIIWIYYLLLCNNYLFNIITKHTHLQRLLKNVDNFLDWFCQSKLFGLVDQYVVKCFRYYFQESWKLLYCLNSLSFTHVQWSRAIHFIVLVLKG